MTEVKITGSPKYSFQPRSDGKVLARYTVQINGENYTSEYLHDNAGLAMSGAKERYNNVIKEKFPSLDGTDLDSSLGQPIFEHPNDFLAREAQSGTGTVAVDSQGTQSGPTSTPGQKSKALEKTESAGNNETQVKGLPRNHWPWDESYAGLGSPQDGTGGSELWEPVPSYFQRPGDAVLTAETFGGVNNNATIVLTRDHSPTRKQVFSKNVNERMYESGYSTHMGSGAIDIVVGRMAPFPLKKLGPAGDIVVAPCFTTHGLKTSPIPDLHGVQLTNGAHPGLVMDAARIYLSQMTDVDENFGITKNLLPESMELPSRMKQGGVKTYHSSAIVLKADKLRLHARRDIKIVTGGINEPVDSQGISITQMGGIHLIAQMGTKEQQPMVLGENLENALEALLGLLQDIVSVVDRLTASQLIFNIAVKDHFHILPIPATTLPCPINQLAGIITNLESIKAGRLDTFFKSVNFFSFNNTYLNRSNKKYINSRHNTVN